jgi:hypothetical protein
MKIKLTALILFLIFIIGCKAESQLPPVVNTPENLFVESYDAKLKIIAAERLNLADEYKKAASETTKKAILERARKVFVASIDKNIFPAWYGTDWDFYGMTEKPGEGKIACGYFVSTVLRDAGGRVNRVTLAQQASENIIKSLTTEPFIRRYRNVSLAKFNAEIEMLGAGLYVVGLDFHVGFLYHDGAEVYFVHSSYVEPSETIREKAASSPVLEATKYRVVGKISDDDALITKWLNQNAVPTVKR